MPAVRNPKARPTLSWRISLGTFLVFALGAFLWFNSRNYPGPTSQDPRSLAFATNALKVLQAHEEAAARTYWSAELLAHRYGRVFEDLWDQLNRAGDKFHVLLSFPCPEIHWQERARSRPFRNGIMEWPGNGQTQVLPQEQWREVLRKFQGEGWSILQCEFRQNSFTPANTKKNAASQFYFSAHLVNTNGARATLQGDLEVQWTGSAESPQVGSIDATALQVQTRAGSPAFEEILNLSVTPEKGSYFIDPLIITDLEGDDQPEIILAAKNQVVFRTGENKWESRTLCEQPIPLIFTAILGDFTGDTLPDFLCATFDGLLLYSGSEGGRFPREGQLAWSANPRIKYGQVLTSGDVDGDGDLDLFLGQYKPPYSQGQMATPYFDAKDGNPWFLLLNDGQGNFTDHTVTAGLGEKRLRRVYSASLVDLDRDEDLDLLCVSDFAGVDAFENDGSGRFADATARWFKETEALGMAHTFADFDRDQRLDLLVIGMNSPTVDRLENGGLHRPYHLPDEGMRREVTFGNRLYFGDGKGRYLQRRVSEQVARSGWSWGCAAADFDHDGFPDVYIANGHESRQSVREYEPYFWLHDIYVGTSTENRLAQLYFQQNFQKTRAQGWSYGGYEKNRFLLNTGGTNFTEVAHLFGLALEADSRNVLAHDMTSDGKVDLVVTTFEVFPEVKQTVRVYQNNLTLPPGSKPEDFPFVSGSSYRSQLYLLKPKP